ncbi:MAG TPA: alpha/beta fold hydrolase [Gemmatimonadaceae bacterium]|nr:alpha/beta fold hydrolase [Gemmatimonadaceae bacterium]
MVRSRRWVWNLMVLSASFGVLTSCGVVTRAFTAGSPHAIGAAPASLGAVEVAFPSRSGSQLRGWFVPGRPGKGAVLLLHGVHANRLAMLPRARFLHALGYAVLMPDFRAHGESSGNHTTFGALEARDAHAAACLLHTLAPHERVAAIGVSLGGAAALLGQKPLPVDALVLESVYPTIDQAAKNRLHAWLGPIGSWIAPSLVRSLEPTVGVKPAELRPIDRIAEVRVPVLMAAGSADPYTPMDESKALFERLAQPKEFWAVNGATHEDLYDYAPAEYRRRVGGFLQRTLGSVSPTVSVAPVTGCGDAHA